jgi:hypothetical protein
MVSEKTEYRQKWGTENGERENGKADDRTWILKV